jgi:hypothetical protein
MTSNLKVVDVVTIGAACFITLKMKTITISDCSATYGPALYIRLKHSNIRVVKPNSSSGSLSCKF